MEKISFVYSMNMPEPFIYDDKADEYHATRAFSEQEMIQATKFILSKHFYEKHLLKYTDILAKNFFLTELYRLEREVFCILFLAHDEGVISCWQKLREDTHTSVFPRQLVERALKLKAKSIVFAHNYPDCTLKYAEKDMQRTKKLAQALALFNIEVKDNLVVFGTRAISFVEGLYVSTTIAR